MIRSCVTNAQSLQQYPVATQVQNLWEEEEAKEQQMVNQEHEEEDEEDLVTDAITGRPYRALSKNKAQQLSADLQEEWKRANPQLAVELPVDSHRQRVISAVESSQVVVIAGETGCGKTTRIPRFLLEECVRGGRGAECNILVTQPRRISAVSVAHRVAQEMGPALKRSVGHQVDSHLIGTSWQQLSIHDRLAEIHKKMQQMQTKKCFVLIWSINF